MDETKPKENAYSGERAPVAPVSAPAEVTAQALPADNTAASRHAAQTPGIAGLLRAAGIILAVMALVNLTARAAEWVKNARERRQLHAMATLTPEHLYARCGAAVVDETKVIYPVLMRTISYHPRGGEKLVISFSRTAEEKSDWVFLSMQNEDDAASYDTPEAKIAART